MSRESVPTFEVTIQRKLGDGWPVVVEQSAASVFLPGRNEGVLGLDLTELRSQTTPKDYGPLLGQALFRDEVRDAFFRARAASNDVLRLLLCIEDTELKTLRWERLCAPLDGRWDCLALDQRVPFSLYLPSLTDWRFPPIGRRDLRALVLVASPQGLEQYRLASFDVQTTVSIVPIALGDSRGLVRALTGDIDDAITNFEAFIDQAENAQAKAQRQRWIDDLRAGKHPFIPEDLDGLRKQ